MTTLLRKSFSSVIVNVCKDWWKPAWSRQHFCFQDGSCWYFSTSVMTDLTYLGSAFFSSAPFRSGGRTQTCEHRSTHTTLLVSHSALIWANIWLARSKWPFVVRNNTSAVQHCTSFNPFCHSSNGLPARMIWRTLRDRTLETSVVAWQHLQSRGLCLCLYSGERDLGFRGTLRMFRLSTIRLQTPVISMLRAAGRLWTGRPGSQVAKQSASLKQHKLRQLFLRQQRLFFSVICLLTQGTLFLTKVESLTWLK